MAACIANALLEQGIPVLMTNFSKILNQMGAMYSEERYRYIASFSNYSLLILDDLGIERSTEYALEQVYAVIDERYKSGLPVIITTNLKIAEIRNPQDVAYARIYSRILDVYKRQLQALVDVTVLVHSAEHTDLLGLEAGSHGLVGVLPVAHHAHALEAVALDIDGKADPHRV